MPCHHLNRLERLNCGLWQRTDRLLHPTLASSQLRAGTAPAPEGTQSLTAWQCWCNGNIPMSRRITPKRRLISLNWLNIQNPWSPRECVCFLAAAAPRFLPAAAPVVRIHQIPLSIPIRWVHAQLGFCSTSFYRLNLKLQSKGPKSQETKLLLWACLWTSKRVMKRSPKLQRLHRQSMKYKSFPVSKGQNSFSSLPPDDLWWSFMRLTGLLLVLRVTGDISEVLILFLLGTRLS